MLRRVTLAAAALVALALAVPAAPAAASQGSVPAVVGSYVSGGALVARLQQLYGPGKAKGSGVDFGTTTKTGAIARVWEWTDDRYAHADSAHPIQLTNYWTVPITIADKPVGVAAVWINPTSDDPELAQFTASASLATALAAVPDDAALVHDGATAAWFAVAGTTATPLVAGRSGVTKATPVSDLALARGASSAPAASGASGPGIVLAVVVLILLVLVILAVVLLPVLRRRRATPPESRDETAVEAPEPEPVVAAAPRTGSPVTQKPATSKPAAGRPGTKPAGSGPAASKPPRS